MAQLDDPRHEQACQNRATGMRQNLAYECVGGSPGNASRFFRQAHIKARVKEIMFRRGVLADLDDAWVLARLKPLADVNIDDYYAHDPETGERTTVDIGNAPREKMVAVSEVLETVERGETKTRVRLVNPIPALELIGRHIGMWPNKTALTNATGDGPAEVILTDDTMRARALAAFVQRTRERGKGEGEAA